MLKRLSRLPEFSPRQWLAVILLVTLLGRVAFLVLFGGRLTLDMAGYDDYAVNLIERGDFTRYADRDADSDLPPLYPFLLASIYETVGRDPIAVAIVQTGFDLRTVALLYLIGRRIAGEAVGLIGAALYGIYPYLLFQNLTANDTGTFILLLTLGIWLALRAGESRRWWEAALVGIVFGIAALTKTFVLLILPFVALGWWRGATLRDAIRLAAITAAAVVLVTAPWIARNSRLHGTLVLISTNGGSNLHQGNNACVADYLARGWDAQWVNCLELPPTGLNESELDDWHREQALNYLADHPGAWLDLFGTKLAVLWSPAIMPHSVPPNASLQNDTVLQYNSTAFQAARIVHLLYFTPLLILGVIGLALALRDHRPIGLLVTVFLVVTANYVLFHPSTRYRAPADPFLFLLTAYALVQIAPGLWMRIQPGAHPTKG